MSDQITRRQFATAALAVSTLPSLSVLAQTPKPRIRIGLIGSKHAHAAGQLSTLRQCPEFEVVGVVEPDEAQRRRVEPKPEFQGLPWLTREQLLNTPRLQAVAVETEVAGLLENAQAVVDAGFHLHLDKPAGESLEKFKQVLDAATRHRRLVKMGYMFRYNPAFQFLIRAVREGWLGSVFSIHTEISKQLDAPTRAEMRPYTGGSMFELGCHVIDSVHRVLGKPARVTPFIRRGPDAFADNMLAVLDYPQAVATVRSAVIEVAGEVRRQFVVCGDRGTCEIRPLEPASLRLMLDRPQGGYTKGVHEVNLPRTPRYANDWVEFARAIRGETAWEFTPEHDFAVQETILRASGLLPT